MGNAFGKHILVVDDEAANLPLISAILRKAGYCVWQAHHPLSALHMAANGIPAMDLLLVDVLMPRYTGEQLAEKLREFFPYMATLYMTGLQSEQVLSMGLELPAWQVVHKPLQAVTLIEKVKAALVAASDTVELPVEYTAGRSRGKSGRTQSGLALQLSH
jgi:two-component system, cell cycle sensor histidine kinase and response regulator CckA